MYDSNTYKYKCSWGESEKEAVYSLLYVEEENLVLTLTSNGIYSFHSDISEDQFFDKLEHYMHLKPEFGGQGVNIGVVIPPSGRESIGCQVWVCSHKEHKFYILDPRRLNITAVVECSKTELSSIMETEEQSHKFKSSKPILSSMTTNIKDMQVLRMHHMRLAVANNWKIPLWSVKERRIMHVFDCKEHCKTRYSNISGMNENNCIECLVKLIPIVASFPYNWDDFVINRDYTIHYIERLVIIQYSRLFSKGPYYRFFRYPFQKFENNKVCGLKSVGVVSSRARNVIYNSAVHVGSSRFNLDQISPFLRLIIFIVRITSLLANEDILSVGLEGGILLSINCTTMDVLLSFHAYDQSVYSLMVMNPLVESNSKPSPQPKTRGKINHTIKPSPFLTYHDSPLPCSTRQTS